MNFCYFFNFHHIDLVKDNSFGQRASLALHCHHHHYCYHLHHLQHLQQNQLKFTSFGQRALLALGIRRPFSRTRPRASCRTIDDSLHSLVDDQSDQDGGIEGDICTMINFDGVTCLSILPSPSLGLSLENCPEFA